MQTYQDKDGKTHTLDINLGARFAIKKAHGFDLLRAASDLVHFGELLDKIAADEEFLFSLISIVEEKQPEELMAVLDGTSYQAAESAFVEALIDFFPQSSPLREPVREAIRKQETLAGLMRDQVKTLMTTAVNSADFSKVLSESITRTSGSGESLEPVGELAAIATG
jgi:hypothetical protein